MAGRSQPLTFSEATSSEAFAERFSADRDARLVELLAAAVTHAHDLIKQFRPTQDEWRRFIAFLTEVGHASDERRQEWVLLSDLIGASALIEDINSRRPKGATPNTIRGPFFRADAPARASASSISLDGIGEPLMVSVRVQDLDGLPVAGAEVVTWQANAEGFYENQQPDLQPEHNLRGLFRTDVEGCFSYRSIVPSGYGVPADGPVGRLLSAAGYPCAGRRICISSCVQRASRRLRRTFMTQATRTCTKTRCLACGPNSSPLSIPSRSTDGLQRRWSLSSSWSGQNRGGRHDRRVFLCRQSGPDCLRRRQQEQGRRMDCDDGLQAGARPCNAPSKGGCGGAGNRNWLPCLRCFCRRYHAHAGRRDRDRDEDGGRNRGGLRGLARWRIDDRPRQGDCLSHRPSADRRADHLCRFRGHAHSWPDGRRSENDRARCTDPAGNRHLRPGLDPGATGFDECDERPQCHGACRRRPLCT